MRTSESTDKIDAAMALVQAALEPVRKSKGVEVDGPKAKWDSKFAPLEVLHAAAKPALTAHGIAVYQGGVWLPGGAGERLVTRLALSGQWIESDFPIKVSRDGAQAFGGGISFAKRWGVCSMVGLIPYDAEEQQGYRDERPVRPQRAKPVAGLAERVASITAAALPADLARRAIEARSLHSMGEEAAAVEKAINAWFAHALRVIETPDELTEFKDLNNKVKPRGAEVHAAMQAAERRILDGKS